MYSGSQDENVYIQNPSPLPSDWSDKIGMNYANRVTGSIKLNDGDNIQDASGHNRIKFTDSGATIFYDEGGSNVTLTLNTDQSVALTAAKILKTDTINEVTTNGGVTIDGVLLKDNDIKADEILEKTADGGVTVDGVLIKDGSATTAATGGVILGKTAIASDVATSNGDVTDNNYSLSHTLTLDGTTADDAEHADITITSDKVLATSVVVGCASLKVDVVVHTVVAGSFKFYFVNKSGGVLANDSTIKFNFTIM